MSIRTLTACLQAETEEAQRRRRFDSARSVARAAESDARPPVGANRPDRFPVQSRPNPSDAPAGLEIPLQQASQPPRQVGIRLRRPSDQWAVPGGIAARFALQHTDEKQPQQETESQIAAADAEAADTASEGPRPDANTASRETDDSSTEEATPITIELKL